MASPSAEHEQFLTEALRAPSAHNAQAWRLHPTGSDTYELHYDNLDYLPVDPDDRDAYLAMGAFYENMAFAAERHGFVSSFEPKYEKTGTDLFVGTVRVAPREPATFMDPLAVPAATRITNRNPYLPTPLPEPLTRQLEQLGNVLLPSGEVADLVREASVLSWKNKQFVRDLGEWIRFTDDSPDGMTPGCLNLSTVDQRALKIALRAGSLPSWIARVYASRDVRLTRSAPACAVLIAKSKNVEDLFDAGRRLLRSWVAVCAATYAYCPLSIVIDEEDTAPKLNEMVGGQIAVAMYRVGFADKVAPPSNRRALASIIRE
jgi:hypothetical protein